MLKDLKYFLWTLKLGALVNIYFLGRTLTPPLVFVDPRVRIPAQIFFAVSAFRCLFPVRYKDNIVFHDSIFSSIFLTRFLATFSEVALIYQLAYVIRTINTSHIDWVDILSWAIVIQVVVSQYFAWGAILTGRIKFYFFEELGWAFVYAVNTLVSAYIHITGNDIFGKEFLLMLNLIFGAVYLPWQFIRLRVLSSSTRGAESMEGLYTKVNWNTLTRGLQQSIQVKKQTNEPQAWGGLIGIIWMTSYWATLIPIWVFQIVQRI